MVYNTRLIVIISVLLVIISVTSAHRYRPPYGKGYYGRSGYYGRHGYGKGYYGRPGYSSYSTRGYHGYDFYGSPLWWLYMYDDYWITDFSRLGYEYNPYQYPIQSPYYGMTRIPLHGEFNGWIY